jgi:glycosyltransferase involved in cell wall biosynthesis
MVGGAHVHVRDLCAALQSRGHDVRVLVGGSGPFLGELSRHGISHEQVPNLIRSINPIRDVAALLHIRRRLRALKPDLLSTHSSKAGWLGRLAARSLEIPVTFTVHGWAFTEGVSKAPSFVYQLVERLASPLASKIITVSDYDKDLALRRHVAADDKMVTIHNGTPEIPPEMLAHPSVQPPRVIMVARFDKPKNHATLLRAIATLQEIPWALDLVGDGPLLKAAEGSVNQLGISARVNFLGIRTDVGALLSKAQLLVLTSNWEALPLSVLEGMRAGLPVIASRVGGIPEAVIDGETGFLVGRADVAGLSTKLRTLLTSPAKRRLMGEAGRRRFETEFSFDRMLKKTLNVYSEVIERLPDPGLVARGHEP